MNTSMLKPGMFNPKAPDPIFGVKSGQGQAHWILWSFFNDVVFPHTTRWFNKNRELVASGGLTANDVNAILDKLPEGECLFMVTGRYPNEDVSRPDFVEANCDYVLTGGGAMFMVMEQVFQLPRNEIHGISFVVVARCEVAELLPRE